MEVVSGSIPGGKLALLCFNPRPRLSTEDPQVLTSRSSFSQVFTASICGYCILSHSGDFFWSVVYFSNQHIYSVTLGHPSWLNDNEQTTCLSIEVSVSHPKLSFRVRRQKRLKRRVYKRAGRTSKNVGATDRKAFTTGRKVGWHPPLQSCRRGGHVTELIFLWNNITLLHIKCVQ